MNDYLLFLFMDVKHEQLANYETFESLYWIIAKLVNQTFWKVKKILNRKCNFFFFFFFFFFLNDQRKKFGQTKWNVMVHQKE